MTVREAETKFGPRLYQVPAEYQIHNKSADEKLIAPQVNHEQTFPLYELFNENARPQTIRIEVRLIPPNENVVAYNVEYKINSNKRREVENQKAKTKASRFVLSLGDSFTFGEGVTTGEDYPSLLAKKLSPDFMVYNFGKPGYGPNDLLFRLQTNLESFKDIKQNDGVAIWYFVSAQLERTACGFRCFLRQHNYYISDKPRYELVDNKLVFLGKFGQTIPFWQKLLPIIAESEALKFGINHLAVVYTENEYKTFVAMLKEIKTLLEQSKNLKKFYFLNTESYDLDPQLYGFLQQAGIEVLDFTQVPKPKFEESRIPYDWHPNATYYWFVSEMLKTTLEP